MRAARTFAAGLEADGVLDDVARVRVELFGSLGATGHGHGSDRAVILGLEGEAPETVDTEAVNERVDRGARRPGGSRCSASTRSTSSRTTSSCTGAEPAVPPERHAVLRLRRRRCVRARADVLLGRRRLRGGRGGGRRRPDQGRRHRAALPVPDRRRVAGPVPRVGTADQRRDARQRDRVASGGRGARAAADDLGGDAAVRRQRLRARGHAAGRAEGAAARAGAVSAAVCRGRTRPTRCASWTGSTCSRWR